MTLCAGVPLTRRLPWWVRRGAGVGPGWSFAASPRRAWLVLLPPPCPWLNPNPPPPSAHEGWGCPARPGAHCRGQDPPRSPPGSPGRRLTIFSLIFFTFFFFLLIPVLLAFERGGLQREERPRFHRPRSVPLVWCWRRSGELCPLFESALSYYFPLFSPHFSCVTVAATPAAPPILSAPGAASP